ncbi:hypothetical protein [Alkalihalobacillus deserti]|uniref:hypothetical protein n=1 Tax=Alkalihalobacillus deserti TaxID=2879466 RepID=UPI001D14EC81|nr:hypothetical protein [Alkalihalobacillus deserti]
MTEPSIILRKIWADEDDDFFEINMTVKSPYCSAEINFYLDNEELKELEKGLIAFSHFKQKEFTWITGSEVRNVTHFINVRFFFHLNRGHVGIEFILDNKLDIPEHIRSQFYVTTELASLDDFIKQLQKLIKKETDMVEGIIYTEV